MSVLFRYCLSEVRVRALLLSKNYAFNACRAKISRSFFSNSLLFASRKYTEKHEWVSLEGKIGTVGISDYAQDALGEVVFVHPPEIGQSYTQDSECGVVESVKAVSEIYTPVSGTVVEINKLLEDEPNTINESCYDRGWLYKIELSVPKEVDLLMDEEAYEKYVKSIEK